MSKTIYVWVSSYTRGARPNQAALVSVIRYCHASNITLFSEKALSATLTVYSPHIHLKFTSYSSHIHPHVTILQQRQLTEAAEAAEAAEAVKTAEAAELRQRSWGKDNWGRGSWRSEGREEGQELNKNHARV